jgi:hypothetical protein
MYPTDYIGRSGKGDYRSTFQQNPAEQFGKSGRDDYRYSRRGVDSFGNSTREEYGHSFESRRAEPGSVANGNTHHFDNNLPLAASNVYYGYGGPFRLDADQSTDISGVSQDSVENFTVQPWMDKISGGTFKRNYLDRVSFRVRPKYIFQ